jgi:hypothetical protein
MLKITFPGEKYDVEVLIRLPRSHRNQGIHFRGLINSAESSSVVLLRPLLHCSLIKTAESWRPWKPMISNDYLKFLGEFEAIFEMALVHESGPMG